MKKGALFAALASTYVLAACQTTLPYVEGTNTQPLAVNLSDAEWDGQTVIKRHICTRYGGTDPHSPAMSVKGIPAQATHIYVSFNDKSYKPMDNGGHGGLLFKIAPGAKEATLPAVPTGTTGLPDGVSIKTTSYKAPCSGGRGNLYTADVFAIADPESPDSQGTIVAKGNVTLGNY